jgi:hypothetical protein
MQPTPLVVTLEVRIVVVKSSRFCAAAVRSCPVVCGFAEFAHTRAIVAVKMEVDVSMTGPHVCEVTPRTGTLASTDAQAIAPKARL